jgi:myo-inositol catabolism protein IolC
MALGYDGKLYVLAFDHRNSFAKRFGVTGTPTPEEQQRIEDIKRIVFDGMVIAAEGGEDPATMGVLVDEQFGADIPQTARKHGLKTAIPVEASGQAHFQFEYGDDFGEHIERYDPDFSKTLIRYNPDSPLVEENRAQTERLKRLSDWIRERDRKLLFELMVPAEPEQLASVDGDVDRYDAELRPDLVIRAIHELQDDGIEPDIWKIEGLESTADCVRVAEAARRDGRDDVKCILLGRGANRERVEWWLRAAAPVDGFIGFAIGRSIWSDPLQRFHEGTIDRATAAGLIAETYTGFMQVYREAE